MTSILLTNAAKAKLGELSASGPVDSYFRIGIEGGGCSGFQYTFAIVPDKNPQDAEIIEYLDATPLKILVKQTSLPYLEGAVIDYVKNLQGSRFLVSTNPNAESACGCGASFTLKESCSKKAG